MMVVNLTELALYEQRIPFHLTIQGYFLTLLNAALWQISTHLLQK